jgi:hypothetical protein
MKLKPTKKYAHNKKHDKISNIIHELDINEKEKVKLKKFKRKHSFNNIIDEEIKKELTASIVYFSKGKSN